MCSERQWVSMFGKWSIDQGGCRTKWHNCIPQDIDTSCRYDNDPRWFPQAMDVTESHHIVLIKEGEALRCKIGPTFYQKIMLDIE